MDCESIGCHNVIKEEEKIGRDNGLVNMGLWLVVGRESNPK